MRFFFNSFAVAQLLETTLLNLVNYARLAFSLNFFTICLIVTLSFSSFFLFSFVLQNGFTGQNFLFPVWLQRMQLDSELPLGRKKPCWNLVCGEHRGLTERSLPPSIVISEVDCLQNPPFTQYMQLFDIM